MKKIAAFLTLALALLALPHTVSAHAVIVACLPRIGTSLPQPPAQLICQFNEPLDPAHISLAVMNSQGQRVDKKDTQFWNGDNQTLAVSLDAAKMAQGIYTTQWAVTNTIDHTETSGAIQFGINTVVPPTPTAVLPGFAMTPTPIQTDTGSTTLISRF